MGATTKHRFFVLSIALVLGAVLEVVSAATGPLQLDIEQKIYYLAKDSLGRETLLDPRLKILAFDDSAAGLIHAPAIKTLELVKICKVLAARGIKTIISSSLTAFPRDTPEEMEEAKAIAETIQGVRLSSTVFLSHQAIKYRDAIPRKTFDLRSFVVDAPAKGPIALPSLPASGDRVYGPTKDFLNITHDFGHVDPFRGGTIAALFFRLDERRAIPNLALAGNDHVEYRDGRLTFAGVTVPMNERGEVMVPLLKHEKLKSHTYSMKKFLIEVNTGYDSGGRAVFEDGDVVYIDATHYTGAARFIDSPRGMVLSSVQVLSLLNSLMTGQWIDFGDWRQVAGLAGFVLAMILGFSCRSILSLFLGATGATVLMTGTAMTAFVYGSTCLPLIAPLAQFLFVGGSIYGIRRLQIDRDERSAKLSLSRDLDLANKIQDSLTPPAKEQVFGRFSVTCFQAKHEALGGDWMAYRRGQDGEVFFAVGDAPAKGCRPP